MKRRNFLQSLFAGAALAPLGSAANPIKPSDAVPTERLRAGEERLFVEDVYLAATDFSYSQSHHLPSVARRESRLVWKRWDGARWVFSKEHIHGR